ncbi:MAG: PilZ domain-containing protein [Desulfuromonadales bacterium]|nr:PilZ domain-containing protein [Desulfuromonadales bacterium]
MDTRRCTRVNFSAVATIHCKDQSIVGNLDNVSLKGLFIKTTQDIPFDQTLDVTVHYDSDASFNLRASAVRRTESGFGLKILGMDVQSFVLLRNEIADQCNDLDGVMRETLQVVSYIN